MSVTEPVELRALSPVRHLPVVIANHGVVIAGPTAKQDIRTGVAELGLLAELSRSAPAALDALVQRVAEGSQADPEALHGFLDRLREAGHLAMEPPEPLADDPVVVEPGTVTAEPFALPVPTLLEVADGAFQARDHEGAVTARLTAAEVIAAHALGKQGTVLGGFDAQAAALGPAALDTAAYNDLVARLGAARLLVHVDDSSPSAFRQHDRLAEAVRRDTIGRRAVQQAIARHMAELDAAEADRRRTTGLRRPKVYPVHCIPTSWRNPPLSLGLIFAYAAAYDGGRLAEHFDFRPDWLVTVENVPEHLEEPSIFLFSDYVWSSATNLEISRVIKELSPHSLVVHGGPDVPKYEGDVRDYFATHPYVDVAVRGEGEVTAAEMLAALAGTVGNGPVDLSVLRDVPGLSYRVGDEVVRTAERDRMSDLDEIPSPYLTGLFDSYVEGWGEIMSSGITGTDGWSFQLPVVVLESNRGCPYGCTFCDWGSATNSRIRKYSLERIFAELDWCAEHNVDTVGMADANFGIFERDVEITAKLAELKTTRGWPRQFGTNYAKNTVKHLKQIVELLTEADILGFGLLSLQAMDAETLDAIQRSNIKVEKYDNLAQEFRNANLPLYVDLMVGLPGQTVRSFQNDLQECINREVHTKIFPTQLLVNSPMNEPAYRAKHRITAKPGSLVVEAASFTREDYAKMLELRLTFFSLEKFGVLRQVARHVRQATGLREVDLYQRMLDDSKADPHRWPVIAFATQVLSRFMVPPVSWKLLLDEVHRYLVDVLGVPDDTALQTALAVQHALLPERNRRFPHEVLLAHDYVSWHQAVIAAKDEGHLDDWPERVPPLRSFGPGSITVEDPRSVCTHEMGRGADVNPWDAWDLASPVSRAVMRPAYAP